MGLFDIINREPADPRFAGRRRLIAASTLALLASACRSPVLASEQDGTGGLEAEVTSTPVPSPTPTPQIWTPTPEPTYTPTATATPSPPQDQLGIWPLVKSNPKIEDISIMQGIIDHVDKRATGSNTLGYSTPITLLENDKLAKTWKDYGGDPSSVPKAFTSADGKIWILKGRPFLDTLYSVCNESRKPDYYRKKAYPLSHVIGEAAGFAGERACFEAIREATGFDFYMVRTAPALRLETITKKAERGEANKFELAVLAKWGGTWNTGKMGALAERPDGRLTVEEEMDDFEYLLKKSEPEIMEMIKRKEYPPLGLMQNTLRKRALKSQTPYPAEHVTYSGYGVLSS